MKFLKMKFRPPLNNYFNYAFMLGETIFYKALAYVLKQSFGKKA
jgi:hypothetical protein